MKSKKTVNYSKATEIYLINYTKDVYFIDSILAMAVLYGRF